MTKGDGTINLEGLAINNGCWGNQVGTCGFANDEVRLELDYQFGHSLISQRLYKSLQTACDWPVPTPKDWQPSEACTAAVQEAHSQQGPGKWDNANTYNFCTIEGQVPGPAVPGGHAPHVASRLSRLPYSRKAMRAALLLPRPSLKCPVNP